MKNLEITPHKIVIYIPITRSKQTRMVFIGGAVIKDLQKILNKNKTNS